MAGWGSLMKDTHTPATGATIMDECMMERWERWSNRWRDEKENEGRGSYTVEKVGAGDLMVVRNRKIREGHGEVLAMGCCQGPGS